MTRRAGRYPPLPTIRYMTVPPEELSLAAEFPAAAFEQWQELALGVLRKSGRAGTDATPDEVLDLLARPTYDGTTIAPLYTAADAAVDAGVPGLPPFVRGSRPEGAVAAGWDVRQRHAHPDPAVCQQAVHADLANGVTSLWLVLGEAGIPLSALPDVLDGVYLDLAPVVLDAGAATAEAAEALLRLAADRDVAPADLAGNLGADPLGLRARTGAWADLAVAADLALRCADGYPRLRAVTVDGTPYHEAGGGDAEELGCVLAAAVAYLRALTAAGLDVDTAFGQLEFRYAATADQFGTIAKLRAARRLWNRVGEVCGATPRARAQVQHAVTSAAMMTRRDPWVNMLRTTLACFGAGVGGAGAVTVLPFDAALGLPDDFARRIARNTQTLLLEEASVGRVIDPAGGSWYVERRTEDLAGAAWAWFTELERAGGLEGDAAAGLVAERLGATWTERSRRLARRQDPLTGVSEFPNLAEQPLPRTPTPAPAGGGLHQRRYAEEFEALRDRADAHLAATGTRPTVFLATPGPVAAHTARATFAANLLAAAGIATVTSGASTDPGEIAQAFASSGTTVACLASSDKLYAEHAAAVAAALRDAGATSVWVAGKPGERADSDAAAGIGAYLYAGSDAVGVLTTILRELGVA
jgi:methylmalonyl-CoA mutase